MNRLLTIGIVVVCFPCLASGHQHVARSHAAFGRAWWLGLSDQNASGFVDGYKDGLPPGPQWKLPGWNLSTQELAEKITDYYTRHPGTRLNAGQATLKIATTTRGNPPLPGGEVYTNRHGYYDGLWWKGATTDEQLGYVEGYLLCLGELTGVSQAKKLAAAISAWYDAHSSREDRAIAYVLAEQMKKHKPTR